MALRSNIISVDSQSKPQETSEQPVLNALPILDIQTNPPVMIEAITVESVKAENLKDELSVNIPEDQNERLPLLKENKQQQVTPLPFDSGVQSIVGTWRDSIWSLATFKNWEYPFRFLPKPWNSWTNQVLVSAAGLTIGGISFFAMNQNYRNRVGATVIAIYSAASLLAVIPWNVGQLLGSELGKAHGMTEDNANYFSSIFAGIFEAVAQVAVVSAISACIDRKEREKWKFDFPHLSQRFTELLLSIPSGMVWAIVYQAVFELTQASLMGTLVGVGAVAGSVALTAYLCANLADKITKLVDERFSQADAALLLRPGILA